MKTEGFLSGVKLTTNLSLSSFVVPQENIFFLIPLFKIQGKNIPSNHTWEISLLLRGEGNSKHQKPAAEGVTVPGQGFQVVVKHPKSRRMKLPV